MKYKTSALRIACLSFMMALFALPVLPGVAMAYTATEYQSDKSFAAGTLIALNTSGLPVAAVSGDDYVGVTTKDSDNTLQVAYTGQVSAFVSDSDGEIKNGTRLGLSSIAGVSTAWQADTTRVGVTTEGISSTSPKWQTLSSRTASGETKNVRVARVLVRLGQGSGTTTTNGGAVAMLQKAASALVGKSVALWQVIAAMVVGMGGLVLAFGLLYSSGRQSFVSLGRNPLASKVILKGMWRIVAASSLIMLGGIGAAFLILKVGG